MRKLESFKSFIQESTYNDVQSIYKEIDIEILSGEIQYISTLDGEQDTDEERKVLNNNKVFLVTATTKKGSKLCYEVGISELLSNAFTSMLQRSQIL